MSATTAHIDLTMYYNDDVI